MQYEEEKPRDIRPRCSCGSLIFNQPVFLSIDGKDIQICETKRCENKTCHGGYIFNVNVKILKNHNLNQATLSRLVNVYNEKYRFTVKDFNEDEKPLPKISLARQDNIEDVPF